MFKFNKNINLLIVLTLISGCAVFTKKPAVPYDLTKMDDQTAAAYRAVHFFLHDGKDGKLPFEVHPAAKIDNIVVNRTEKQVVVTFNPEFGYIPFREPEVAEMYSHLQERLGKKFRDYRLRLIADRFEVYELIPNALRSTVPLDSTRLARPAAPQQIVRNLSKPYDISAGLQNRHIALWGSHGWYFDAKEDRWKWQRARVFQIVEDLLPTAFISGYLVPMLENAGATVFQPRERDLQTHEIIVDNDDSIGGEMRWLGSDSTHPATQKPGFALGNLPYRDRENPFRQGSYWQFSRGAVQWTPDIPETGEYGVYIAYQSLPNSSADALYTVHHSGGGTVFRVDQRMGGGTWIYLGTFHFPEGKNPATGSVTLSSDDPNAVMTADAVRFGGGMGIVSRNGKTGGRPKWMEGSRYYLQFAGMPDTLVYNVTEDWQNDYTDDYRSRGEWVNYLRGAPFGPNKNRQAKGLGIPVDLSLAFHTDAGSTGDERTVGTLMIVGIADYDSSDVFPDSVSRLASRDFGDLLQMQIVDDLRQKYNPDWQRRSIWDKDYSEAFRPNVPAALLELLSHHNFADMKFALDPRFRFDASRAIYKAMLKFLAFQNGISYAVQPLPVTHFSAEFAGENSVLLRWQPQPDSLEATADPTGYVVYTAAEYGGFDNGRYTTETQLRIENLQPGTLYRFKVAAVNGGGESFPSEILAVCQVPGDAPPVLIVNGFDRICGPAAIEAGDFRGFADFLDQGVPDKSDICYVGSQIEFDKTIKFVSNDYPGQGASHSDFETRILPGNTFDFPAVHGRALRDAGYSFVSASDEAVWDGRIDLQNYEVVDLILGEEKTTPVLHPQSPPDFAAIPSALQAKIRDYLHSGGAMLISGAHFASDLWKVKDNDSTGVKFAGDVLKLRWVTDFAASSGSVVSVDSAFYPTDAILTYNSGYHPQIYTVEAPDALAPADSTGKVLLRYAENGRPAAIAVDSGYRLFLAGFPVEAIVDKAARRDFLERSLKFLRGGR